LNELKNILKTSNTYLQAHMGFYILWQFVSIILLMIALVGIYMLFGQLKGIAMIFGI